MISASKLLPGVLLASLVGVASVGIARLEELSLGHPVIEGLVVAILLGMVVRTMWTPPDSVEAGVKFTAKEILEVAILLLGISIDLPLLVKAGPALAIGIVTIVVIGLSAGFLVGKLLGLPTKLAILVACGNAICGNSAIAAIAPVIKADKEHVASAIAFSAIMGVIIVLGLPLLMHPLGLSFYQYGVLAGLTVYAVPQVLAAAFPVSVLSGQVGTLVKLVRVLMLGPVVLFFAVMTQRRDTAQAHAEVRNGGTPAARPAFSITRYVPWFIIGFIGLAVLRSMGVVPASWVMPTRTVSTWLTVAAMAALGLGVDLKAIRSVGKPVIATVSASLILLIVLAVSMIHLLGIS
ncbi:MAG: YeiH family protein [Gemmatimonadaceae bacterium]